MSGPGQTMKRVLRERSPVLRAWSPHTPMTIQSREVLSRLKPAFVRTLGRELDVRSLSGRMCPVMFEDGSAGVFTLAEYCHDDQTLAILDLLEAKGYRLNVTALFVLAPALLLAIDRVGSGDVTGGVQRASAQGGERSALDSAFNDLVAWGLTHGASDMHLNVDRAQPESAVRFTVAGRYVSPECYRNIPTATMLDMLAVAWMDIQGGNGAVFDPSIEQQGRLTRFIRGKRVLLRWASLATDAGPSVCMRLLVMDPCSLTPDLHALGYLPSQVEAFGRTRTTEGGAVVLAGVVGSGKSTTIATLLRDIPADRKVITLEDPAEYLIPNALQNTICRALDEQDEACFDTKLKTLKRSAMNDLLIGEIRDTTSGRAFMDLAGCGTNLYTTVHAGSALLICERLTSSFIGVARDFLATPGILNLLVFQSLVGRLCPECALSAYQVFAAQGWHCVAGLGRNLPWFNAWLARIEELFGVPRGRLRFRSSQGCARCNTTGIPALRGTKGRTVVAEMIEPAREPGFLEGIKRNDVLGLHEWFHGRARTALSDPCMDGKSAQHAAVYKMYCGQIDPREVESRFGLFEQAFNKVTVRA